ncbi:hypothetical protein ABI59_22370 [Acidobacteria bacterium Mor1]|nr:hypothetical protein ABI59_22370 [Acidobacteria bacterium Mor1]
MFALLAAGCASPPEADPPGEPAQEPFAAVEARSLLGKELAAVELSPEVRAERESRLEEARAAFEANPESADALIWVGRRTAYLGRYRDALAVFSGGIEQHPEDARLYRHRGHRHITLRQFDDAIRDLERAAALVAGRPDEIEPDGLPNARNQPTSTLQSNIWYHLGLAYYVSGNYEAALAAYRACLLVSKNPDMLSATTHWLYMTLHRLDRDDEAREALAPIHAEMDIIENHGYHRLLLMYKGELPAEELLAEIGADGDSIESASVAYGLANWLVEEGDSRGEPILETLARSPQWAAFGVIAAEADLARRVGS